MMCDCLESREYAGYTAGKVLEHTYSISSAPRLNRGIFAPMFSGALPRCGRRAAGQRRVVVAIQDPKGESGQLSDGSVQPPGTNLPLNKAMRLLNKSIRRTAMSAQCSCCAHSGDAITLEHLRAIPYYGPFLDALDGQDKPCRRMPMAAHDMATMRLGEARAVLELAMETDVLMQNTPAANALAVVERMLGEVAVLLSVKGGGA